MPATEKPARTPIWRRRRVVALAAFAVVAVAIVAVLRDGPDKPAPPVAEAAARGDVRTTISGVGTLQPTSSIALSFIGSGRVTSVRIAAGERAARGQVLATLDDTLPRARLLAARASLVAARSALEQLRTGRSPYERRQSASQKASASRALADARTAYAKAGRVAKADASSLTRALRIAKDNDRAAAGRVKQDRRRLQRADGQLRGLTARLAAARAAAADVRDRQLGVAGERRDAARRQLDVTNGKAAADAVLTDAKADLADARSALATARETMTDVCRTAGPDCVNARAAVDAAQAAVAPIQARVADLQRQADAATQSTTDVQKAALDLDLTDAQAARLLEAAQLKLTDAQADVDRVRARRDALRTALPTDRDALRTATQAKVTAAAAERSGRATRGQTLAAANAAVEQADSALDLARATAAVDDQPARPAALDTARQNVETAASALTEAKREVEQTVLRAPADGVAARVGLNVGDTISGSGTSRTSPAAGASPAGAEGGTGGDAAPAPGAGPAIVLNSGRLSLMTVPLTQSDSVRVRPGVPVEVYLHSARLRVRGRLLRVSPDPTMVNGVVTYAATVATRRLPKRTEPGMTGDVTIIAAERRGVVVVPASALSSQSGRVATVQVLRDGRRSTRTVAVGLRGDDVTEVRRGLRPGDRVVVAADAGAAGGPPAAAAPAGGDGGFGGGDLGGGGDAFGTGGP